MKNRFLIAVLLVFTLLMTGCGSSNGGFVGTPNTSDTEKQNVLTCSNEQAVFGAEIGYVYEVTFTGDYVEKIKTEQTVTSDDVSVLDNYSTLFDSLSNSTFDGYSVQVLVGGNTVTLITTVDYTKVDLEKLSSVAPTDVALVKDGKLLVSDIKSMYETAGAICK